MIEPPYKPYYPEVLALLGESDIRGAAQWLVDNAEPWEYISVTYDIVCTYPRDAAGFILGGMVAELHTISGTKKPFRAHILKEQ